MFQNKRFRQSAEQILRRLAEWGGIQTRMMQLRIAGCAVARLPTDAWNGLRFSYGRKICSSCGYTGGMYAIIWPLEVRRRFNIIAHQSVYCLACGFSKNPGEERLFTLLRELGVKSVSTGS